MSLNSPHRQPNPAAAYRQQIASLKAQLNQSRRPLWPQPRKLLPRIANHTLDNRILDIPALPALPDPPVPRLACRLCSPVDFHDFWNQLCAWYVLATPPATPYDARLVARCIAANSDIASPQPALVRATSLNEAGLVLIDSLAPDRNSLYLNPVADIWNYFTLNLRPIKNLQQLILQFDWLYNNYQFLTLNGSTTPTNLIWILLCKWRNYKPLDHYLGPLWNKHLQEGGSLWPDFEHFLNSVNRFIRLQTSTDILKTYSQRPKDSPQKDPPQKDPETPQDPSHSVSALLQKDSLPQADLSPPPAAESALDAKIQSDSSEFSDFEDLADEIDSDPISDLDFYYDLIPEFDPPKSSSPQLPSESPPSPSGPLLSPSEPPQKSLPLLSPPQSPLPFKGATTIKSKSPFYELPYLSGPSGTANSYKKKAQRLQHWKKRCHDLSSKSNG
ncbi:hypothetical protein NADFUDRAFT_39414 [Nadsonia fulvescens var. elongata DSM 6958]|uniref:Uncharacterized protein n=1 Tax=Nadsonia fulvescens var. elongata DSM 6958 TaxID=857566 RepID=A0A1E3PRG3_9ASCO|nr:hypothetical protein NADFUDRAFT_39414 [Nadsonia fulvescens var. elongata DSM 6958]